MSLIIGLWCDRQAICPVDLGIEKGSVCVAVPLGDFYKRWWYLSPSAHQINLPPVCSAPAWLAETGTDPWLLHDADFVSCIGFIGEDNRGFSYAACHLLQWYMCGAVRQCPFHVLSRVSWLQNWRLWPAETEETEDGTQITFHQTVHTQKDAENHY